MKTKFLVRTLLASLTFSLILFVSAGKLNYFQGWIFLGTNLFTAFLNFWTIRNDPELMTERSTVGEGAKSWDKKILGLSAFVYLINVILAGFDSGRYEWSPPFHWSMYVAGVILSVGGQLLFLSARKENKYFSSVVRIQTDRGHAVCDTGVYKLVRHPGYLGMTLSLLAIPFLTGSAWSTITTGIAVILLFIRTYLEDGTLKHELPGYKEYMLRTRKRLIPGIW